MRGSISQRSRGSWFLRYDGPPDATGRRKQVGETVRGNKSEADRGLRDRMAAVENGGYVAKHKETVGQFMESWLNRYASTHTRPRTVQGYRQKVNSYIVPCLGQVPLQQLTPRHVQDFHKWMLEKGLSNQSVVHAHRVLSEALKQASAQGVIVKNPAGAVSPPRAEPKEVVMWDDSALVQFLEAAKDSPFFDAFKLALFTGMRRSELTGLRWKGVDFAINTLRVTETLQRVTGRGLLTGPPKSKAGRRALSLGAASVALFHSIRGKQMALQADLGDLYQNLEGYVLTDGLGQPIDSNRLSREFHRIVKTAGLPAASLHSLRDCHSSLLLAEGVSIKAIAERLGHSNPALTLNIYSHLLPGLQENAVRLLDKRLESLGQ